VLVNMSHYSPDVFAPTFTGRRLQWRVHDPFNEPIEAYRAVRDQLETLVRKLLEELEGGPGAPQAPPVA